MIKATQRYLVKHNDRLIEMMILETVTDYVKVHDGETTFWISKANLDAKYNIIAKLPR